MANTITLTPAYGRNPKTAAAARKVFESGKDWLVASIHTYTGRYCSIRDLAGYDVTLRFNNLSSFCVVKLKPKTVAFNLGAEFTKAKEDTHIYCNKCDRNLRKKEAGSYLFADLTSLCDCSWRCCKHSESGPGRHGIHLVHRPVA